MKDRLTAEIRVRTHTSLPEIYPEAESGLWGLQFIKILGPSLRKIIGLQEYEYKIRYEKKYFCRMRKEITTNYKLKEAGKYKNLKNP